MPTLTIRNLDVETKDRLRVQAAHHRRSMEEEARVVLKRALADSGTTSPTLDVLIRRRFGPLGGVELDLPPREPMRAPPKLTGK